METFISILFNPATIAIVAFIAVIGFLVSPYEIHFDEKEE